MCLFDTEALLCKTRLRRRELQEWTKVSIVWMLCLRENKSTVSSDEPQLFVGGKKEPTSGTFKFLFLIYC